jgi:hypothetical protein
VSDEFSVYWWGVDSDTYFTECRFVSAKEAFEVATDLPRRPFAAVLGMLARIIITDGGDCTVWEWEKGKGVTFPPPKVPRGT